MSRTLFYDHRQAPLTALDEGPLAGLRHRTVIDARTGAASLALWQEEHEAGFRVPPHRHDCEEIIAVHRGTIEATVGGETFRVGSGQSILIPAWDLHGFQVVGPEPVQLLALFASSRPRILRADGTESDPPWEGGASDHLEDEPALKQEAHGLAVHDLEAAGSPRRLASHRSPALYPGTNARHAPTGS